MRAGKVATCVKLNLSDLRNVELAAMCGFDCVWVDMEHVPNDMGFIENAVRAARNFDCDLLTRVSRGGYSDYIRPLEADSPGIMVPHLMSLKDADYVRYYTKFHPIGRRPIDGGNMDCAYCLLDGEAYLEQANRERFVIVQIEDRSRSLSSMKSARCPAGYDLLRSRGFFAGRRKALDFSNPYIDEVRRLIAKTARKYGKFAGTVGGLGNFDALVAMGYQFISLAPMLLRLLIITRKSLLARRIVPLWRMRTFRKGRAHAV
jgi:4-hydroxy-2-oxoheptanedioate aldolase